MRTYLVGPEHPIARGELEGEAETFVHRFLVGPADGAVLAKRGGEVIGWLRFNLYPKDNSVGAAGTWVEPEHRSLRVAQAMWARFMRAYKPKRVEVTTVTKEGRHLVGSIVRWFPKVEFDVR